MPTENENKTLCLLTFPPWVSARPSDELHPPAPAAPAPGTVVPPPSPSLLLGSEGTDYTITPRPATGWWCDGRSRPTTGTPGGALLAPTTPSPSEGVFWVPLAPDRRGASAPRPHPAHWRVVVSGGWSADRCKHRSTFHPAPSPAKMQLTMFTGSAGFSIRKAAETESQHMCKSEPPPGEDPRGQSSRQARRRQARPGSAGTGRPPGRQASQGGAANPRHRQGGRGGSKMPIPVG